MSQIAQPKGRRFNSARATERHYWNAMAFACSSAVEQHKRLQSA